MTNATKASLAEASIATTNMTSEPGLGLWNYSIVAGDITNESRDFEISPDAAELPSLARALDVLAVHSLSASITLHRTKKSIRVRGEVQAVIDQSCVVSLEPVQQKIKETIDRTYVSSRDEVEKVFKKMNANREMMIDIDEVDPPEVMESGRLDLAAIALEHVVLGIDLYPRSKNAETSLGAAVDQKALSLNSSAQKESPFSALAELKIADASDV